MAFTTLTLNELVERARQAFRSELPGTDAWLWPNNINVSAKVMAGMTHLNLMWLAYIAKQRWVSTADGEFLDKHGFVYAIPRLSASYAKGSIILTGTSGTTVPSGLGVQRDDGIEYVTTTSGIIDGYGNVTIDVAAKETGSEGNALAGGKVFLTTTLANVNSDGVVAPSGIGLGASEEGDESYRARLLWRLRMPPMGGASHDYVAWARQIPGVTRVFVDPLADGPGTVTVYFLMDDLYTNGIPQGADVQIVNDYIQTVKPATAVVTVRAPIADLINVVISNLSPNTVEVRDAIHIELDDLFRRDGKVSMVSAPYTLYRSKLWQAIADASGEDHHILSAPATDLTLPVGHFPILGTITYT